MSILNMCALLVALATCQALAADDWIYPLDAAAMKDGGIVIADRHLPGILLLKEGQLGTLVAGTKTYRTPLNAIRCVHVTADGTLLAGDSATREVYKVAADGTLTALTGGKIGIPTQIASTADTVYVTDLELQRVWKFPMAGGEPVDVAVVAGPRGVAADGSGNVWILSPNKPQLRKIAAEGAQTVVVDDIVFNFPNMVQVAPDGTAYVSDGYEKSIWKIAAGAAPVKWITGEPLVNPVGISWQGENLLIVDPRAKGLYSASPEGKLTRVYPAP